MFVRRAKQYGAFVTVGGMSEEPQPPRCYPEKHRYNSAFVYAPGQAEPARYNKIHLVPFGEYVPFRYSKRLFWLYRFLNDSAFNPWGRGGNEYSLTAGKEFTNFELRARSLDERAFRFGITICYEDVIPQIFRRFVTDGRGRKRVDFMLNISNDGWFGRGPQQPQHLVNCAFRAVENRVAVARAANTGVSGFIRPDGLWHDLMSDPDHRPRAGGMGHRTARLQLDPRVSFYSCYGDLFAGVCAVLALAGLVDALVCRRRERRASRSDSGRNPNYAVREG
jgi:apolipoprotein N-acyltransferase